MEGGNPGPKKGNLSLCKSYRGIMLLSTNGKVMNRNILDPVDEVLRENQAGFRPLRSTSAANGNLEKPLHSFVVHHLLIDNVQIV